MPNNILADYDSTSADLNTDIGGISIAEGMLPSAVNNSIRELTKQLGAMADGTDALTALSVDNLKLDGNTIVSTDTNGNITLDPNGTGNVTVVGTLAATAVTGDGSALTGIAAGATGGGDDQIFYENGQTVTTNYTITDGKNAMSAGPITINSGVTVTVGTGETWTVV